MKQRIEYIDLAKSIGMLLVIYGHAGGVVGLKMPGMDIIGTFHVPLFFIMSGFFFRDAKGFFAFSLNKCKTILFPFCFFFLLLSYLVPGLLHFIGSNTFANWHYSFLWMNIWNEDMYEGPLWFLIALFFCSLLYKSMCNFVDNDYYRLIVSIIMGYMGWKLDRCQIKLPLFLDSSLVAIMFYGVGCFFQKKVGLNIITENRRRLFLLCIAFGLAVVLLSGVMEYYTNTFDTPFINVLICGTLGSFAVLLFAKILDYIPILNYLGQNSILLLCSHMTVMRFYRMFSQSNNYLIAIVLFSLTVLSYIAITPLVIKYFPYLVGKSYKNDY